MSKIVFPRMSVMSELLYRINAIPVKIIRKFWFDLFSKSFSFSKKFWFVLFDLFDKIIVKFI